MTKNNFRDVVPTSDLTLSSLDRFFAWTFAELLLSILLLLSMASFSFSLGDRLDCTEVGDGVL